MTLELLDKRKAYTGKPCIYREDSENSVQGKILMDEIASTRLRIKGSLFFALRVKKALKVLGKYQSQKLLDRSYIKVIISSQNLHYDRELGILYLDRRLSPAEIAYVIRVLAGREDDNAGISITGILEKPTRYPGVLDRINRKFFRHSVEKKLEDSVLRIISSPPLGRVATEDQHFLMTIVRLEMFAKGIARKIEKNSIVYILEEKRKKLQKKLLSCQKKNAGNPVNGGTKDIIDKTEVLDLLIFEKKMLIQNRLFKRITIGIDKWSDPGTPERYREKTIRKRLLRIIERAKKIQDRLEKNDFGSFFGAGLLKRQITGLKKERMRLGYISSVYDKKKKYAERLKQYMGIKHNNELIPEGYRKSGLSMVFDILRAGLNILFMGSYIYFISLPAVFIPVFLAAGLFVFQSIANKFAILFISVFVKNSGLKRLPDFRLKEEMEKRAGGRKYFCAIDLPLFTGRLPELETTVHYIRRNLANLKNTLKYFDSLCILYQITSNTSDKSLVEEEVRMARRAQKLADLMIGRGRVFFIYLHRNSGTAKKVGNIIAAHLFKYRGITSPDIYTDEKKFLLTFEKRPFFDRAWGAFCDTLAPGAKDDDAVIQDILRGKSIDTGRKIDFTFFVDNKNEIKQGSLEKALSIMMHPANGNISILQPRMSIEDPVSEGQKITSAFLRMMRLARDTHNERYLNTLHTLYGNMSAYYGKGMIRLRMYDYMITREVLNIRYVDSHDWQESVFNNCAIALSGNKRIHITRPDRSADSFVVLIEKKKNSFVFRLVFKGNRCTVEDERGNTRSFAVHGTDPESRIRQVLSYVDNGVEVGERELISTIGNNTRDSRWLKGDLQMFNTFMPYLKFLPAYHRFHLENIFRRLTNEIALFMWVGINFIFAMAAGSAGVMNQELLFMLSLYLAVTAFGFAGIDLFIYPVFFEISDRIKMPGSGRIKGFLKFAFKLAGRIVAGIWQFILYLLIAWPRIIKGIKSNIQVLAAGIDQPVNWGGASNASISAEETAEGGIPFKSFFSFYRECLMAGAVLVAVLSALIINEIAFVSIILPFNMGIIAASLLIGPVLSYFISKKIKTG